MWSWLIFTILLGYFYGISRVFLGVFAIVSRKFLTELCIYGLITGLFFLKINDENLSAYSKNVQPNDLIL